MGIVRVLAASVLVVLLAATGAAAGHPGTTGGESSADRSREDLPDVAEPRVGDPVTKEELQDLQTVADEYDLTLDEAIERYAWRFDFSLAVAEIRGSNPEAYAFAEISGPASATVWFAGAQPEGTGETLANFRRFFPDIDVDVRTDFGLNEAEIDAIVVGAHAVVFEATGDGSTEFDHHKNEILIAVPQSARASVDDISRDVAAVVASSGGGAAYAQIGVSISVASVDRIGAETSGSVHFGGESLSTCTSGFALRNVVNGTRRGTTAGHCSNTQSDDGSTLTTVSSYNGTWGDWQTHYGSQYESDDFYSGNGYNLEVNRRDTSSVGVPVSGQTLCKNGKAGLKDCIVVDHASVCVAENCYLIKMDRWRNIDGDSGGPVFYGTTAYGAVEGTQTEWWGGKRDLHSRADKIPHIFTHYGVATT